MSWLITGTEKTPLDQDYRNVSLLLHGDGANGSTTIIDSSPSPKTVTAVGDAQISTAQSKFGGSSIAFDGTGDSLVIPSVSFDVLEDLTLELFLYKNANGYSNVFANSSPVQLGYDLSSTGSIFMFINGAFAVAASGSAVTQGVWNHLAWTRQGSICRVFVNGVLQGSGTKSDAFSINSIGATSSGGGQAVNGYIDDLRITKGVARYTSNFTPPTAPFPDAGPAQ